jgi:hypothetical protein
VTTANGLVTVRCELSDQHTGQTSGSDERCCVDTTLSQCECGPVDLACDPQNTVARCDLSTMRCPFDRTRVDACSF